MCLLCVNKTNHTNRNRCGANEDGVRSYGESTCHDNFITRIECNVSNDNNFSFVPLKQTGARTYEHRTSFELVTFVLRDYYDYYDYIAFVSFAAISSHCDVAGRPPVRLLLVVLLVQLCCSSLRHKYIERIVSARTYNLFSFYSTSAGCICRVDCELWHRCQALLSFSSYFIRVSRVAVTGQLNALI